MLAWVVIDRQQPRHFRNSRPVRALPLPSSRFYFQSKIPTGSARFNVQMSPIPPRPGFYSHFGSHPSPSLSHIRHPLSPLFSCTYEMQILQPLCFQLHACNGGCPLLGLSAAHPLLSIPYPLSYQTLAHFFAFFCTFLHSRKTQLFYFQSIPHSLQKTTRGGGHCCPRALRGEGNILMSSHSSRNIRRFRTDPSSVPPQFPSHILLSVDHCSLSTAHFPIHETFFPALSYLSPRTGPSAGQEASSHVRP